MRGWSPCRTITSTASWQRAQAFPFRPEVVGRSVGERTADGDEVGSLVVPVFPAPVGVDQSRRVVVRRVSEHRSQQCFAVCHHC